MAAGSWSPPLPNGWLYRPPVAAPKVQTPPQAAATAAGKADAPAELATRSLSIFGTSDDQARRKVQLIRDLVVKPALGAGPNGLAFTRGLLAEALGRTPAKVANGYAQSALAVRIFEWVKSRIRYTKDPAGRELFQQLPALMRLGTGDCDDFTALLAALFTAAGIKVKARIIRVKQGQPWAHIYPVAFLDGKWRAFDGALPPSLDQRAGRPGFEYPNPAQRLDLEIS